MSSLPLAVLGGAGGFASDPRFSGQAIVPPAPPPEDPVALAWADGHAAGYAEAQAEAALRREADDQARARIELALARLDAEQGEVLRQRLVDTVTALCEAALLPLALDPAALAQRATRAAAMLARADDAAVLRLHPDDLALIEARLPAGLPVEPDPTLERGALRLEGSAGGVEDGPAQWRRAVAEALGPC
ncbi:MAG: FliH/SctL family protein [Sphingomonadaceae bacterium]|nr:FliH/SctL family protein [Sphingomonadaceae bacterium]